VTTLLDETVGNTSDTLEVEHVSAAPTSGAGVDYPSIPAGIALQLGALGIVLGLLSCAYAHVFDVAAAGIIIPVAFSVGAIAIFVGGLINFRAGILVAGCIGCLYGAFWLSIGYLLQFSAAGLVTTVGGKNFGHALGTYFLIWGIMSLGLCLPVYFVSKVVFTQQLILAVVFFVLAIGEVSTTHSNGIIQVGGFLGILDALFCFYISMSLITNETAGKTILPLP
jgi:succinate-acetate transporter protein